MGFWLAPTVRGRRERGVRFRARRIWMAWRGVNTRGVSMLVVSLALVGSGAGCGDDDAMGTEDAGGGSSDAGNASGTDGGGIDSGSATNDAGPGSDSGPVDQDGGAGTDGGGQDAGSALPTAVAEIVATDETDSLIEGTVTFTQDGDDVTVVYEIRNCPDGSHETHIHGGTGCRNRGQQGMHWDGARGEGIPDLECTGGTGTLTYTRTAGDRNTQWSIGGPAATDVVGHPVVIHGAVNAGDRIGCGVIETP